MHLFTNTSCLLPQFIVIRDICVRGLVDRNLPGYVHLKFNSLNVCSLQCEKVEHYISFEAEDNLPLGSILEFAPYNFLLTLCFVISLKFS